MTSTGMIYRLDFLTLDILHELLTSDFQILKLILVETSTVEAEEFQLFDDRIIPADCWCDL